MLHTKWAGFIWCVACVAVYCSVLQCVAACCSVLQCVASTSVHELLCKWAVQLRCVAVCCSLFWAPLQMSRIRKVCCSVLQCVAVCCSVLQCVAVCFGLLRKGDAHVRCVAAVRCSMSQCLKVCRSVLFAKYAAYIRKRVLYLRKRAWDLYHHTLQHAETNCNTLQHTTISYITLQRTGTWHGSLAGGDSQKPAR